MSTNSKSVFQVNLKGMISLLSEHIYSNPATFIRELLQNGIDAITAFRSIDETFRGQIQVTLEQSGNMIFQDNGIGLTEQEIHEVLTVIGESSKRSGAAVDDFIGRFGIGLLSCFVVSNEIVFETLSALSKQAIRWKGRSDGTYETTRLEGEYPIGTRVLLTPKPEWKHLFGYDIFRRNITFYGNSLPYPVLLTANEKTEQINDPEPVWCRAGASREELLEYGKKEFRSSFLDAFPVHLSAGKIRGTIYILPFKTQFSGKLKHRIYLKKMLLSEDDCHLLPSWAFFVKCVLNAETLSSTASRESLVNNEEVRAANKEIGEAIKTHLSQLIVTDRELFNRILEVHFFHIKAIAAEDNNMLELFMDMLPFETNRGDRNFATIRTNNPVIYYTTQLDHFKQIRRITSSQGMLVINAAYTFDESLLKKSARLHKDLQIEEITPAGVLDTLKEVDYTEHAEYKNFEKKCTQQLKKQGCTVRLKHFSPVDTPVLFIPGEKNRKKQPLKTTRSMHLWTHLPP
ncbi:MAG: HSP90 family protein [Tannerellaceae bacterium]|nr:HSP90 family protein [Tannerellaceae bacterium]